MDPTHILHLEAEPDFSSLVRSTLEQKGMPVSLTRAGNRKEFEEALETGGFQILLVDYDLLGYDGISALKLGQRKCPWIPFIFLSGHIGEEEAIESLNWGACDFVFKDNLGRLLPALQRALLASREATVLRDAQERIRRDQANLRSLIENTGDAVWSLDLEFRVLAFNSAASLLAIKMTRNSMEANTDFLLGMDEGLRGWWEAAAGRVKSREGFTGEFILNCMGRSIPYEVQFSPVVWDGQVEGMAVLARDMTLTRKSAQELKESEERYRNLVDVCPDAVFVIKDALVVMANPACMALLGARRPQDVLGQPVTRFFPTDLHEKLCARMWQPVEPGKPPEILAGKIRRNDALVDVEVTAAPFQDGGELACQLVIRDSSEREAARKELRASRDRLDAIVNGVSDLIIACSPDGQILFANEALALTMGYLSPGEAMSKSRSDFLKRLDVRLEDGTPLALDETPSSLVMRNGNPSGQTLTRWRRSPTEEDRWAVVKAIPILDDRKHVDMIIITISDVTEVKRAQKALEASEARFRTLTEAAFEAITVLSEGRIVDANPAMLTLFGYTMDELRGRGIQELVHPDSAEEVLRNIREGREVNYEVFGLRKDGSRFPMEVNGKSSSQAGLRIKGIRDLTERKKMEEERQSLFNLSSDLLCIADFEGYFLQVNDAWERVLGYTREELTSRPYVEFVHPEDRIPTRSVAGNNASGNEAVNFENRYIARDGTVKWLMWGASTSMERKVIYAVARDITERKSAEVALLNAKVAAEEASMAKGQFLANMSHEIRTPMNGVLTMADLLWETPMDAKQRQYLKTIRTSSRSLVQIIDDILDFSKVEQGMLRLEMRPFDLLETVAEVIAMLETPAQEKGLDLRWSFSKGTPRTVKGDGGRLRQILVNLVGNAVKFTSAGRVELRISHVKGNAGRFSFRFEVEDSGIGIAPEAGKNLFQAFSQSDASNTRRYGGTGLGLAICRQLATLMGGEVGYSSEPGKGSLFWLDLVLEGMEAGAERVQDWVGVSSDRSFGELRILVAEDNEINQLVIASLLERMGCKADLVGNGREAIRAFRKKEYDLIFMDCQMPELDGYSATIRIRLQEKRNPGRRRAYISAMTADALAGSRERCLASGMDGYLSKPIIVESLLEMLKQVGTRVSGSGLHIASGDRIEPNQDVDLDNRIVHRLRDLSDKDVPGMFRELVGGFLGQCTEKLALLGREVSARDLPGLAESAHGFKGLCLNFGALAMAKECDAMQRAAERGLPEEIRGIMDGLVSAEARARRAFLDLTAEKERCTDA